MTEQRIRAHRITVEELIEAVVKRDPQEVARVLNPLRRDELEAVAIILADYTDPTEARQAAVIRMSAYAFKITPDDVTGPSRDRVSVDARSVAGYALRLFDLSYPQISKAIGRADHTSAIGAVSRAGESPRLRGIATGIATELGWSRPEDGAA